MYFVTKMLLNGCANMSFYKGYFPSTAGPVIDLRFSFVHLDVDLYESTKSCLEFFYPRLNVGGVISPDDYVGAHGVWTAFEEFFFGQA